MSTIVFDMTLLQERKRQAAVDHLVEAALSALKEHGLDVTVDEIVTDQDVCRRWWRIVAGIGVEQKHADIIGHQCVASDLESHIVSAGSIDRRTVASHGTAEDQDAA